MTLLDVRSLGVGYRVPGAGPFSAPRLLPIVHDASFTLDAGRTLGVVGESGCGKSTLGRALLRLIEPSGGQVLWQGQDMATLPDLRRRRSEMQIIFQDPVAALDPRMTLARIAKPAPAPSRPWGRSASPPISPTATRTNSPAGRRSGWASHGRWSAGQSSSSATNPSRRWMSRSRRR
jgi:ABC-type dipeptide/oligopeptide/nickel transport system ATPase subunit